MSDRDRRQQFQRGGAVPHRQGDAATRRHRAGDRPCHDPGGPDPADAGVAAGYPAGAVDHHLGADPDDGAVHPEAAGIQLLPDHPADHHAAAAVAQPGVDAPDPGPWPRRPRRRRRRDRSLRRLRHGRQLRHRRDRLRDPGHRELRRHHQGFRPYRRSGGALHPGRHARQADGDRRRPVGRPDRRAGGAAPPQGAGGGKRFFGAMDGAPSSCAATPSPA